MKGLDKDNKNAVDYLLGDLAGAARDEFEERLFADDDLGITVTATENDLIDEYLRGELTSDQKRKFELNFLVSERRREKLLAAEVLLAGLLHNEPAAPDVPLAESFWARLSELFRLPNLALAGGLAVLFLILVLGGFRLLRQGENEIVRTGNNQNTGSDPDTRPPSPAPVNSNVVANAGLGTEPQQNVSPLITPSPQTTREPREPVSPKPTPMPKRTPQTGRIFAFTLFPVTRSSSNPVWEIPETASGVLLTVVHNEETRFVKFRAELRDSAGGVVWNKELPATRGNRSKTVRMTIESGALRSGSYELTLIGITPRGDYEEINFYNFTVKRK